MRTEELLVDWSEIKDGLDRFMLPLRNNAPLDLTQIEEYKADFDILYTQLLQLYGRTVESFDRRIPTRK